MVRRGGRSVLACQNIAFASRLAAPTASLVASLYLDDVAEAVERKIDPTDPRGRPLPFPDSLYVGLHSPLSSLAVNLAVLALTIFTESGRGQSKPSTASRFRS
jgi:uncharacterized protein involved in cysteine biosynthesis